MSAEELIARCLDASLSSSDRANACSQIGEQRPREAVAPLLSLARRVEDPLLLWGAMKAICAIGSKRATRPLLEFLRSAEAPIKRQAAVYALGALHDRHSRDSLIAIVLSIRMSTKRRAGWPAKRWE